MDLNIVSSNDSYNAPCQGIRIVEPVRVAERTLGSDLDSARRMNVVLDFIDKAPIPAISLDSAAALVFLSPSRFRYLFRQRLGVPFHQYVMRLRLKRADYLLSSTNYSVVQISRMLGMEDKSHFTRDYKKAYGISPGARRRSGSPPN
ncbi:MAG: helix-turn-helix transcriptional regulator [Acidobacteriota bacterium]|nr:helix-turn-helix transcriptional regulator [Acidobacteriota bacterium]